MILSLQDVQEMARRKPAGWLDAVTKAGQVVGGSVVISRLRWVSLSAKTGQWGDVVEVAAKPIARAIDRVAGTNIKGCGGCAKRREALNRKA